ncbi:MAG: NUDIX domain-containing protein [Pirellulaceae bacterium]
MSNVPSQPPRRGAVAVIVREERLLVVRRSQHVAAPGRYCFPGGGIEPGESEAEAVRRELLEELGVVVEPMRQLWRSITPWNVDLAWWLAEMHRDACVSPDEHEVESAHWLKLSEILALEGLLESNRCFLQAMHDGVFEIEGLRPPQATDFTLGSSGD